MATYEALTQSTGDTTRESTQNDQAKSGATPQERTATPNDEAKSGATPQDLNSPRRFEDGGMDPALRGRDPEGSNLRVGEGFSFG